DLHRTADLSDHASETFLQLVVGVKHVLRFAIKDLARRGQFYFAASANALQQAPFELVFQRAYLLADSGLCNKISLGRQRKTLKVDQVAKNFQGLDMHSLLKY